MHKTITLLFSALVLSACATSPPKTPPDVPSESAASLLSAIFTYENVKTYDYRMTSYTKQGVVINHVLHTVSTDTVDGVAAWKVTSELILENSSVKQGSGWTEFWFAKKDGKCLKVENVVNVGSETRSDGPCGPTITVGNPDYASYPYIRDTTVKLPLGSYDVKMYGIEGAVIYFMAKDVDVPIMMTWGKGTPEPGTTYFELEKYEE